MWRKRNSRDFYDGIRVFCLMKTLAIGSFFVLFAIVSGIATIPSSYAESTASVSIPLGTGVLGCETTNECFIPFEVTVDIGGVVTWSNDDTTGHTVTSGADFSADDVGTDFDSSLFFGGSTFEATFDTAGEFPYFCQVHPWMIGTVTVQAAMMEEEVVEETMMEEQTIMIAIETGSADAGEMVTVDLNITYLDGDVVEHVNYNIMATQGDEVVLDEKGVHDHDGVNTHTTMALPLAASDDMPLDVTVTFNGFGLPGDPMTGPIGEIATKQVVPEFGTIAMMILAVSIVSIIAVTTKSRVIPRL